MKGGEIGKCCVYLRGKGVLDLKMEAKSNLIEKPGQRRLYYGHFKFDAKIQTLSSLYKSFLNIR